LQTCNQLSGHDLADRNVTRVPDLVDIVCQQALVNLSVRKHVILMESR
jgi:hypothetical protein